MLNSLDAPFYVVVLNAFFAVVGKARCSDQAKRKCEGHSRVHHVWWNW